MISGELFYFRLPSNRMTLVTCRTLMHDSRNHDECTNCITKHVFYQRNVLFQ